MALGSNLMPRPTKVNLPNCRLKTHLIRVFEKKEILNHKARITFSNPHWLLPEAVLSTPASVFVYVMAWFGQVSQREKGLGGRELEC